MNSVQATGRPTVAPDGITSAEPHVYLTTPGTVSDLAHDAADAWASILAGRAGLTGASLHIMISAALARHSVLPSQVRDRLTQQPVAP